MIKKEALLLIFLLLLPLVSADLQDTINLGESKYYLTPDKNISIKFSSFDTLKERANFLIDNKEISLLLAQTKEIDNFSITLLSASGDSLNAFSASFFIQDIEVFECSRECINNSFANLLARLIPFASACKTNCSAGCSLYHEKICEENRSWIVDNCNNKLESVGPCEDQEKDSFDFCISDKDCDRKNCVSGKCTSQEYIEGDEICSLPEEPCNSSDCSCDNYAISKGKDNNPIILLHGFTSSPLKFKKLQRYLSHDIGYANGGEVSISDISCPTDRKDTVYVATYYENKDKKEPQKGAFSSLLESSLDKFEPREIDGTAVFSDVLSQVISKVKACSGSDKVDIIAHSMGGLVTLSYISESDNAKNIDKAIFLGTPIKGGIYGEQTYELFKGLEAPLGDRKSMLKKCSSLEAPSIILSLIDGRDVSSECQQMSQASFSDDYFGTDETPGIIEYYTISGDIDGKGDSVVTVESTQLDGAVFNKITDCNHFDLKNPSKCKEAYYSILSALGYSKEELKKNTFFESIAESINSIGDSFLGMFE